MGKIKIIPRVFPSPKRPGAGVTAPVTLTRISRLRWIDGWIVLDCSVYMGLLHDIVCQILKAIIIRISML